MATMTSSQKAELRGNIGDVHPPFILDDGTLQNLWDRAVLDATGDNTARASYYALLRMKALLGASTCNLSDEDRQARLRLVGELLNEWKANTGIYGGALFTGVLDLGLDQDGC